MTQTKYNSATEDIVSLIFTASRLIRKREKGSECADPFSYLQLETLRFVSEHKNPPMRDIAEHLYIAFPSATSLINRLVRIRYLERVSDKNDRRMIRLSITPKGQKMFEDGFKEIKKRMGKILSHLNEREANNLIQILKKLLESYKT